MPVEIRAQATRDTSTGARPIRNRGSVAPAPVARLAARRLSPYLSYVKLNPLFDPLRKEPRFQAIERELKFPD